MAPVDAVAFGLTVVWALVGFVDTRAPDRAGARMSPYHLLASRRRARGHGGADGRAARRRRCTPSSSARDVATLAAVLVTAISFHFLLALPTAGSTTRSGAAPSVVVYVAAVGVGIGLVVAHRPFTVVDGAISWTIAAVLALAPMRARYIASDRAPPGAHAVVRHRRHAGGDGRPRRHGAAPAGRLAGGRWARWPPRDGPGPPRAPGQREPAPGAARQPRAGAGTGGLRFRGGRLGHLPGAGARPRPRAEDDG